MLVADYEYFFIIPHAGKKMVAGLDLGSKFGCRIYRGINFAAESLLGCFQGGNDIAKAYVTYYHQVHIAAASLLGSSNGTIDEGQPDATGQGRQRLPQYIANPGGLHHQAL
jgi:hypothetical protein